MMRVFETLGRRPYFSFFTITVAFGLMVTLSRCAKVQDAGPASGTFSKVYAATLKTACIECHVPGGSATIAGAQLDFTTQASAYSTLTTKTVTGGSSSVCSTVQIVKASDPTNSYLAGVLFPDYYKSNNFAGKSGCAPYNVHLSDQNLTSDEKSSMIAWITNGAKND